MESWNASACIPVKLLDRCLWNRSERQPLLRAEYILALAMFLWNSIAPILHHSNTPSLQCPTTPYRFPCIQPLFACVEQAIFRARSQRIDAPRLGSILACLVTRYENQESTS
jgi:hypothetical protein